ncbi:Sodium/proton antiporter NhaA 1 [Aurantiacibacter atlanticus]|uniref:Na(+)/H(+) antiporter NhaA n=1 Tax=Aurantiacibacter atlanticus TaxID=1648404 RepID=A0A0H4VIF9_9SPHN|nr:Na+/H+ antiporter NhaA [Aurantiacibacter atlanticus]AKQ42686.1 Sodium/proton antiporter NhaA 1 [Aurantiacibacter atlanticus]MDF1834417.1 Na+/H+ antiporter NhaA [Alteraurantiacibacter sp. bin_em_oilr2.035]
MSQPSILKSAVRNFSALFRADAFEGILLIAVAIIAMVVANSDVSNAYFEMFYGYMWSKDVFYLNTLHLWINDGLMVIFFFVVGLEVKRELISGNLSDPKARNLPILAAIAGMAAPAAVYMFVAGGEPALVRGWAIPAATDIAFAMGVVGLLGTRVPSALRLFLLTVAIVDDIGAVTIIAVFYTETIKMEYLAAAAAVVGVMVAMNRMRVSAMAPFVLLTVALWYCVLYSGVHATIAGVLAALTIPMHGKKGNAMLEDMEHAMVPWNAYIVVPLFGFANAGVDISDLGIDALLDPLPLAVAAGLVVGKQVGIFSMVWAAVKVGFVEKPAGSTWVEIWGVSILCGIGFTMSLFIGELAFQGTGETMRLLRDEAKIGILTGSLISAVLGYGILRLTTSHPETQDDPKSPVV